MSRAWARAIAISIGAVTLLFLGPFALRHMDFFRVRRLEIVGARYLGAAHIISALELPSDRNLFDDNGVLVERLRGVPGVSEVEVGRRLPGTLRILVRERVPVAFAIGTGGLVPLGDDNNPLPFDPLMSDIDLPVIAKPDTMLVRALSLIRSADASLFDETQSARRVGDSTIVFELGEIALLFHGPPTLEELTSVSVVREHLAVGSHGPVEVDARYHGWVVVRGAGS